VIGGGKVRWKEYLGAIGTVALTAAICLVLRSRLQTTDIAMLFLLAVVFAATRWHRGPALTATLLTIAAFDYGFVPPYYTFNVSDDAYFLTFAVMLVVALVMGRLTARIREQAEDAEERERRTAAAYALSRELTEVTNRAGQIAILTRHLTAALGGDAAVAIVDAQDEARGGPRWPSDGMFEDVAVRVAAIWAYEHGEAAGPGTPHCAEAEACIVPLRAATRTIGVIVVRPAPLGRVPDASTWRTASALAEQASVALERADLAERHEQARIEVEAERLRTALLSSLSHDLRTPLGTIEGAASSLLQDSTALPLEARSELAETIVEESRRMTRLVGNLLDMVRVETGGLAVKKSWQPLEESLGVALLRLEEQLKGHPVGTRLPSDLPMVPIDELLIEQVFLNLLENAAKYTPPGTPIAVAAWAENGGVVVEVADRGPGVLPGAERAIFQKFHRASQQEGEGPVGGAGLGLTICEGIIAAHGGRIWVQPGAEGGAAFRFTLPLEGPPLGAALADVAAD
jgi:two-component system, OmpR family, sensor histidine kinase KdpD